MSENSSEQIAVRLAAMRENITVVREKIARAAAAFGRDPSEISLVAATKTMPKQVVDKLPEIGVKIAGENRAWEFNDKYDASIDLQRHFIGVLQTNKVKYLIGRCALIQSVDRENLAEEIDRQSAKAGVVTNVLLEVNVGGEVSKSGISPALLAQFADAVCAKKNIAVKGIMTVLPIGADDSLYDTTYDLFRQLSERHGGIEILSMGMSGDYEKALRHGANMVRIGSALFGSRQPLEKG